MNIVHATWEQKNMGVDCYEVELDERDTWEDFLDRKKEFETEYTVVKFPTSLFSRFGFNLQQIGYRYIETMISAHKGPILPALNPIQKRILNDATYEIMHLEDVQELYEHIKMGMFSTDRISVDPFFSKEQSNNRYIGWIQSELQCGSSVFKVMLNDKNIGFFTWKKRTSGVYDPFIGGLYQEKPAIGMGFLVDYFSVVELQKCDGHAVLASVSTNNKPSLGEIFKMGYSLDSEKAVFIYHGRKKDK